MKKVIYITRSFPVHSQTFIVNQVIAAINEGFEVGVLTYHLNNFDESSQISDLKKNNIEAITHPVDFKIPKNRFLRYIKGLFLFFKYFKYNRISAYNTISEHWFFQPFLVDYFINYQDVDVFHIHFANSGLDIAAMKKIGVIKGDLILSVHGFSVHSKNETEKQKLIATNMNLFQQSKYITVNSPYLFDKMINLQCDQSKLRIVPMGVDTDFFTDESIKTIKNKALGLISVGRLIPLKGHKYGIEALKKLINEGISVHYTIIGIGREEDTLKTLVKELKLDDHVSFMGLKSQTELREQYSKNHVFLMTSITDDQNRAEAQGIVTLEAQSMGLPVVAFDSGGVSITLTTETGILVEEKSVDQFAEAISKLYLDKNLYSKMSSAARAFVRAKFSLQKLSKKVVELYD